MTYQAYLTNWNKKGGGTTLDKYGRGAFTETDMGEFDEVLSEQEVIAFLEKESENAGCDLLDNARCIEFIKKWVDEDGDEHIESEEVWLNRWPKYEDEEE